MKKEITRFCLEIIGATKSLADTEETLLHLAQEITLDDQFQLLKKLEMLHEQKRIQEDYLDSACTNFSNFLKAE